MPESQIVIEGLSDLRRALSRVDADFGRRLKETNIRAATVVVNEAKANAAALGGVANKAAGSLRATRTAGYAAVRLGGARHPYALGGEFGGGARSTTRQFKPFRKGGYFLYPAIRSTRDRVIGLYDHALEAIVRSIGGR